MNEAIVYLNGELTPLSEARVPVLDRGFIFGDGIYEVIPMYGRKAFRGKQHLARLFRSLAGIGIPNPHDEAGWMDLIDQVVQANGLQDQMIYLQVTRGVAKRAHAFPKEVVPTVLIMTNPMALPSAAMLEKGVACVTMEDRRWLNCQIKSTSLLGNVLAAQFAAENEVTEAIQFRDGFLSEASASNVWVVKDGKISAPPKDNLILEGIRYGLMEELCAEQGIALESRRITREEVLAADELMISSASKEVLPVVTLDGQPVGSGRPGPVFARVYAAYQAAKARL
ncbi:D-amino acid aminotransferase [Herbaspirillum seropedicae]|uniref:Branched-chain amino acid aminotransferase/4-amino-4-deoxychorismate lyase protein n=1 Tax=Herbaspirillum seropedicae (strain SmR1) TaxID=757424 RepID=D8IZ35_HERSS|nr:D-amino acid aminotransferase [Herbaspirillum seropedicae]ADJ66239.1 branched-chain amino acid aminotransferase/4-amino-4-deoxychorismate lyase protein [Herbaspirillum seropedicae SmR1]AKN67992.1 cytochrome C550 [Herbaspirillum seropedicae]AON57176.1 branched-chain amino acid aminotransferase/4-amino-4-deoxychorismate lyase [Herbaspirillum seropedicae]MDR6398285.1 D-alanine transaminase [Herbaspirillum seropedicae]NQE30078.1 cytochrome C550 [Herbaspirillum seropedicae]